MDGLCNVTGADGSITLNGTKYRLSVPTQLDYGELERDVVARRSNPLRELAGCLQDFSLEDKQLALRAASDSIAERPCRATQAEVGAFSCTLDGISYTLYLMLRRNHPEIDSPEKAGDLIKHLDEASSEEMLQVLRQLSEVQTAAKNSPSTEQITETTETTDLHESRGLASIVT
jgi:hypothetical protein